MKPTPVIKDPVISKDRAITEAGSAAKLARALNVARASVSSWGKTVPPLQAYRLLKIFPSLNDHEQS